MYFITLLVRHAIWTLPICVQVEFAGHRSAFVSAVTHDRATACTAIYAVTGHELSPTLARVRGKAARRPDTLGKKLP